MFTGTLASLFAAQLLFVGGHFLLSAPPVRARLVDVIGERPFLGLYSLIMIAALAWVIAAYRSAPLALLYDLGAIGRWLAVIAMPFAFILVVLGLIGRSPTAVMGERNLGEPRGAMTISRHPFLAGAALWALAHLAANGDAAAVILFGGMLVLAVFGMMAIDAKRAKRLGSEWQRFARQTSRFPFAAASRTRIDWSGIGWARPLTGLILYALIAHGHRYLFGVPALPTG